MTYLKNILSLIFSLFGYIEPCSKIQIRGKTEYYETKYSIDYFTLADAFELRTIVSNGTYIYKYNQWWIPDLAIKSVLLITYYRRTLSANQSITKAIKKGVYAHSPFFKPYNVLAPLFINTIVAKWLHNSIVDYRVRDIARQLGIMVTKV